MKIDILTLFPEILEGFINSSIMKRAQDKGIVTINLINFREYSPLNNKQVDDTPYGGGAGMVLRCEPIFECLDRIDTSDAYVVMLSPEGKTFNQHKAVEYAKECKHLIILCGHYEGFDERIKTRVDEVISVGDYVLTGGEIPACAIVDAVVRLLPGVITSESLVNESFNDGTLDYPTYTKPAEYRGLKVPDVLLSGNHAKIDEYRKSMMEQKTMELRPDLKGGKND